MRYFSVKNWDKFQHYKDRNPPWIKFYTETLEDYEIESLPDHAKGHLFMIWLLAARRGNRLPMDERWIANKIGAKRRVDLKQLASTGWIIPEQDASEIASTSLDSRNHDASKALSLARSRETETETETEKRQIHTQRTEAVRGSVNGQPDIPFGQGADFDDFWNRYPRKGHRVTAIREWQDLSEQERIDAMASLDRKLATGRVNGGKYSPTAGNWLRERAWEDPDDVPSEHVDMTPEENEAFVRDALENR